MNYGYWYTDLTMRCLISIHQLVVLTWAPPSAPPRGGSWRTNIIKITDNMPKPGVIYKSKLVGHLIYIVFSNEAVLHHIRYDITWQRIKLDQIKGGYIRSCHRTLHQIFHYITSNIPLHYIALRYVTLLMWLLFVGNRMMRKILNGCKIQCPIYNFILLLEVITNIEYKFRWYFVLLDLFND